MNRKAPIMVSRRQQGVSLIFALIALVVLTLSTLALVRNVDNSALLLGNIGLKQDATIAGDQGARQAIQWLKDNVSSLDSDNANSGYYASSGERNAGTGAMSPVDVTGQQYQADSQHNRRLVDWDGAGTCSYAAAGTFADCALRSRDLGTVNGINMRYVIFRQCLNTGSANDEVANSCAKPLNAGTGASGRGALAYGSARFGSQSGPYYRVVVRASGARNTVSYTESIFNFQ